MAKHNNISSENASRQTIQLSNEDYNHMTDDVHMTMECDVIAITDDDSDTEQQHKAPGM